MTIFAQKLKEYRTFKNYSQKELADILNVSQNAIYNWENDKREPSLDMISKIATALNVSVLELLGLDDYYFENYKSDPECEVKDLRIAAALNISLSELHELEEYKRKKIQCEINELKTVTLELNEDIFTIDDILISDRKLLKEFHELNTLGKKEAILRVSELKYIPGYTGDDGLPF